MSAAVPSPTTSTAAQPGSPQDKIDTAAPEASTTPSSMGAGVSPLPAMATLARAPGPVKMNDVQTVGSAVVPATPMAKDSTPVPENSTPNTSTTETADEDIDMTKDEVTEASATEEAAVEEAAEGAGTAAAPGTDDAKKDAAANTKAVLPKPTGTEEAKAAEDVVPKPAGTEEAKAVVAETEESVPTDNKPCPNADLPAEAPSTPKAKESGDTDEAKTEEVKDVNANAKPPTTEGASKPGQAPAKKLKDEGSPKKKKRKGGHDSNPSPPKKTRSSH